MASARGMCARDCNVCNFHWQMGGHLLGRWASVRGAILLTTAGSHSVQLPRLSGGWEQIFNICTRDLRLGAKSAAERAVGTVKPNICDFDCQRRRRRRMSTAELFKPSMPRFDASSWARHTCANISRCQLSPMVVILLFTTESISSAGRKETQNWPFFVLLFGRRGEGAVWEWLYLADAFGSSLTQAITWTPGLLTCEPAKDTRKRPSSSRNSRRLSTARKRKLIVRKLSAVNYFLSIAVNKNYVKRLLAKTT